MLMRKIMLSFAGALSLASSSMAQINAALFRFPDVSRNQIVFVYANDLWVVPKEGGRASHLSSPAGTEIFPKFSPDGKTIAYTADYDGNNSVYTIPSGGGVSCAPHLVWIYRKSGGLVSRRTASLICFRARERTRTV